MQWFKHDTDATMDSKIRKVIIKYGAIGYAIYFHCLELIASGINENNITFELEHDSEIIADDLRIKGTEQQSGKDLVEEIMRFMVSLNLFEESKGHIFCFKLLKRLDASMTSSKRMRDLIKKAKEQNTFLEQQEKQSYDTVMIQSCCSHDTVMLEEKRREEKRKDNTHENFNAREENSYEIINSDAVKNIGELQKELFRLVSEHNQFAENNRKIPVSRDFISFVQKECRELISTVGVNEPAENIIQALKNFISVAQSDTWKTSFSWSHFCKHYIDYSPDYFTMDKYLNNEYSGDDAMKRPENVFFFANKDNPRFDRHLFQNHLKEWKEAGRPQGEAYFNLQKSWEQE